AVVGRSVRFVMTISFCWSGPLPTLGRATDNGCMAHHDHREPTTEEMDADFWDATYAERPTIWSGQPNAQLVAEVADLSPGFALDVGSGEGADAVWLAQRGWDVTGVDISPVALERAREHAAEAGVSVTFEVRDLLSTPPSPASYDLVSAQFFQLADPERSVFMRRLGDVVRPGGQLLVVGHLLTASMTPTHVERFYTPDEITALFSVDEWVTEVSETRERTAMHHGEMTDLIDAVVRLRRRG
ncbi:MAG: class SAM-dependent methyltransferase, partial [Aeromicrobium sp.]|nr:class SAM-dependent methyltransferase [Aeromicrobium sp.]